MKTLANPDAFIAALAADMKSALAQKSAVAVAALEDRRHQLLAHHLGFAPRRPIEPITVIGDSHTLFFAGENGMSQVKHRRVGIWRPRYITRGLDLLPCFQTRHLGPATAWRAFDYKSSTRAREKIRALVRRELPPGSTVLLSFGEIDCRCHIPKAALTGTAITPAVQETVARFLHLATSLRAGGLKVAVWGPAMVTIAEQAVVGNPLPTVGPFPLRAEIARAYCAELNRACAGLAVPCVCLAGTYHDWQSPAAAECFIDGCHLSQIMMASALRALQAAGILTLPPPPLPIPPATGT
jgi:hypothetical protein